MWGGGKDLLLPREEEGGGEEGDLTNFSKRREGYIRKILSKVTFLESAVYIGKGRLRGGGLCSRIEEGGSGKKRVGSFLWIERKE